MPSKARKWMNQMEGARAKNEKLLFQMFFLKNDENQSVEGVMIKKIDFTELKKSIGSEESVFVTPRQKQKSNPNRIASKKQQNLGTLLTFESGRTE